MMDAARPSVFFAGRLAVDDVSAIRFGDEGQCWEMMPLTAFWAHSSLGVGGILILFKDSNGSSSTLVIREVLSHQEGHYLYLDYLDYLDLPGSLCLGDPTRFFL